jgi:glyoxylase-like metal-dependent hydrolase (beta-lactamase superfamily II)
MTRIAEGVHRLGSSLINFYLVEDGDRLTVVDAGLPGYRKRLDTALAELGRSLSDVEAVLLTHGHADHVGFAESVRSEAGVPVYIHEADERLALTGKPPRGERGPVPYLWRPQLWRLLAHGIPNGGLVPPKVAEVTTFGDDATLDVPGRPRLVPTPGHTRGCVTFVLEDRGVALVGDALCTKNPLTGRDGPQIMPASFTVDVERALDSLERIESLPVDVLAPGHGDPWTDGPKSAVARARELGPS